MRTITDISGQTFNRLTVLYRDGYIKSGDRLKVAWVCQCSCGNIVKRRSDELKNGNVKSCGCLNSEVRKATAVERGKKLAKPPGVAGLNAVVHSIRKNAAQRGISFSLTKEDIRDLTSSNCYYCGCMPCQAMHTGARRNDYIYNGIDRVDNSRGYDIDNCVPCCGTCNSMKKNISLEMVKKVYEYACSRGMLG